MTSPAFSFNRENAKHVFHVFLWTTGSALVTMLISLLASADVPAKWVVVVPIVNTLLVALKEWTTEHAQQ